MQTAVSKRGQTVIPAAIRKRYGLTDGGYVAWLDDGETIRVVPIPVDPVRGLRGHGRGGGLTAALLAQRHHDRGRE